MLEARLAEVATECYWLTQDAVLTRRALRTKWARVDLFGADVVAIFIDGTKAWTQVTTAQRGESVRRRRRKLEAVPWHPSDRVFLFEVEERPGVVRRGTKDYFFRVHEFTRDPVQPRGWRVHEEPIEIPRAWFKASTAKALQERSNPPPTTGQAARKRGGSRSNRGGETQEDR